MKRSKLELTREKALEFHRQMWSDMREELGDNPPRGMRSDYKRYWIRKHFPELEVDNVEIIRNNCFLCEYAGDDYGYCECPIDWPCGRCEDGDEDEDERNWLYMPISKLLELPERKEETEEEPADVKDSLYLCDLIYSAEGECTGYMYLTEQEYETVKKVVNTCNWNNVDDAGYAGRLSIYCKKLEEKK